MKVFGVERHFLMTVGASAEIASFCPNGDLSRLGDLLQGSTESAMLTVAKICAALNKGYEQRAKFLGEEYHEPLTVEAVLAMDPDELAEMQAEALSAFTRDTATTIKATSKKNNSKTK